MKKYIVVLLSAVLLLTLFAFGAQAADLPEEAELASVSVSREEYRDAVPAAPSGARNASALSSALRADIKNAIMSCAESVDISKYNLAYTTAMKEQIAAYIFDSTPEFFNVEHTTYYYNPSTNQMTSIAFFYHYSLSRYNTMMNEIGTAAAGLLSGVKNNSALGNVEKALLLHDRLALRCEYDPLALKTNFASESENNGNLYGALVSRKAVCQGYAEAYQYLLTQVGIESFVTSSKYQISGGSVSSHAWNVVYIGGKPYHADVTWDDASNDITGRVLHKYFLISTNKMLTLRSYATSDYDFDLSPVDTTYDGRFWTASETAFTLVGNSIYYLNSSSGALCKYPGQTALYTISNTWPVHNQPGYYYSNKMARLATDGTYLFFNTDASVIRYSLSDGSTKTVYTPSGSGKSIVGFAYEDGYFVGEFTADVPYTLSTKGNDGFRYRYAAATTAQTLGSSNVTLSASSFTYNGKVQQPAVTVKNAAGSTLTNGTSYTVTYSADSKLPGSYTVTVTGKGNYTGTVKKTYAINKQALNASRTILSWTAIAYNGAVQKPSVTVKNANGDAVTLNTSYTVSYSADSKAPGSYTVTVTGKGNYSGTIQKTYTINKQTLAAANVTLSWTAKTYNGAVQKPSVTVKNAKGESITLNTSYTYSYSADSKAPGSYTVTVTGKGNFTGTVKKTYTINKQALDASRVTLSWTARAYNGAVQKPTATVKNAKGEAITLNTSYTVSYSADSKAPGSYTVTVTGKGNFTGTVKKTYTISKQTLASANVTLSWTSKAYTGNVSKPSVTVKNAKGEAITRNTSYTVSYSADSKAPGSYTVTVTGKGNFTGTVKKTYTITKAALAASRVTLSASSYSYDGKVHKPTVTVKSAAGSVLTLNTSYRVSYSGDCKAKGTYTVTVTGTGNYTGTVSKTFTIK